MVIYCSVRVRAVIDLALFMLWCSEGCVRFVMVEHLVDGERRRWRSHRVRRYASKVVLRWDLFVYMLASAVKLIVSI